MAISVCGTTIQRNGRRKEELRTHHIVQVKDGGTDNMKTLYVHISHATSTCTAMERDKRREFEKLEA